MQRMLGAAAAAMVISINGADAARNGYDISEAAVAPLDVAALLTAAHGAPPMICALAAQSVRNYGWGDPHLLEPRMRAYRIIKADVFDRTGQVEELELVVA